MNTNYDYNGSAWTVNNAMNTARALFGCTGTQTAALAAGGTPGSLSNAETYDGTNWTAITSLPAGRRMMAASGPQTQALVFGGTGASPYLTSSVLWDGSSWATDASMATGREFGQGSPASPGTAALSAGGYVNPGLSNATEEYNNVAAVKTITTS